MENAKFSDESNYLGNGGGYNTNSRILPEAASIDHQAVVQGTFLIP